MNVGRVGLGLDDGLVGLAVGLVGLGVVGFGVVGLVDGLGFDVDVGTS